MQITQTALPVNFAAHVEKLLAVICRKK